MKGQNGVKFLENRIVELKINEDLRLYNKKIYKNPDGEYLIIFDHKGNHEKVQKAQNKGFIKIIETTSAKLDISYKSSSSVDEHDHELVLHVDHLDYKDQGGDVPLFGESAEGA